MKNRNEERKSVESQFSVLMSLYVKEKAEYADQCFQSLLRQTVQASEWVIVEDGPLTPELYALLDRYQKENPGLIRRVPLEKNRGLGLALRTGVPECSFELIARMDTDDIAREDRFERQLKEFAADPELDICGSHIIEFEGTADNELARRKVPLTHDEIVEYQKTRSAFNHMTVMYRKSAVLRAGNYEHCPLMEDDMLWVRMILSGSKCSNIDDYLVYARTGTAMIERRGGWGYFKKYRSGKRMIKETGFIGPKDYLRAVGPQLVVSMMPPKLRLWVFTRLLRTGRSSGE